MSTARADLRVKNSSPAPAAQREHEPGERRGIPPAVPDYSKLTILSQPRIRPAGGSAFGTARRQHIAHASTCGPFFLLFIVSIRRNKADAARN